MWASTIQLLKRQVSSSQTDIRFGQFFVFAGAIGVLACALFRVRDVATTPFEIFVCVMLALMVALLMVVLGMVLPIADKRSAERRSP
jgi:hypothetical protein